MPPSRGPSIAITQLPIPIIANTILARNQPPIMATRSCFRRNATTRARINVNTSPPMNCQSLQAKSLRDPGRRVSVSSIGFPFAFNLRWDRTSRFEVCKSHEPTKTSLCFGDRDAAYSNSPIANTQASARPRSIGRNSLNHQRAATIVAKKADSLGTPDICVDL